MDMTSEAEMRRDQIERLVKSKSCALATQKQQALIDAELINDYSFDFDEDYY